MAYCRGEVYTYRSFNDTFEVHLGKTLQAQGFETHYYFKTRAEVLEFLQQEPLKNLAIDAIERLQRELGEPNAQDR